MSDQQQEKQIAQGLSQLGETTTAAELLRQKGQTRKLRVIGEKQLMAWILSLLQQHMAGKEDAFSDAEKAELLKKTQDELNRRIKREQEAQAERDRLKEDLAAAMAAVSKTQVGTTSQAEIDASLLTLREKLEQAEQINLDLQQDNYDLQDQLNEKMALLSTTIAEKDKLRDTVRQQMMRMTALCEGVLGIDNEYYGAKHQGENEVSEEATQDEQFYHDFDVGAKVITTLQADLERLRGITQRGQDAAAEPKLLAGDLALLEQLKSGSLHAVDVAAPVAGMIEALDGARAEAEAFETQVAEATGAATHQVFSDLPDATGDPAEILADATAVVRELAASLARNRNRIAALKAIADESDEARHGTEEELEAARAAFEQVCTALRQRAEADQVALPAGLADRDAAPAARATAAVEIVEHLQGASATAAPAASPVDAAALEQLALTDRLVRSNAPPVDPKTTDRQLVADRLRKAGHELERYTIDLQRQLDEAVARERALSAQVRELGTGLSAAAAAPSPEEEVAKLATSLADADAAAEVVEAASRVAASLRARAGRAEIDARTAATRSIAAVVVSAAEGDDELADQIADLSLSIENPDGDPGEIEGMVREAIVRLGSRRRAAETERARIAAELARRDAGEAQRQAGSAAAAKAHSAVLAQLGADLVKAADGDPTLADAAAELAVAVEGDAEALEPAVRDAVMKLSARKRALEAERARLAADLEAARSERVAAQASDKAGRELLARAAAEGERLKAEFAKAQAAEQARCDELARVAVEEERLKSELAEAQAEVDDLRARGNATSTNLSGELATLRAEIAALQARHQEQTASVATLRQSADASDARLKRQREELNKRLEERDAQIAEKDRTIDQLTAQRSEAKALEAKLQAATADLAAANARIHELERRSGDTAGEVQRAGELAEMQKRATAERDQLRDQKRRLEGELADARGLAEEAKAELLEVRKAGQTQLETHLREVAEEREKSARLADELRRLKEDVSGLRARLRRPG